MSQRWEGKSHDEGEGGNESQGLTTPVKPLCCHEEHEKNPDGNDENQQIWTTMDHWRRRNWRVLLSW